MSEDQRDPIEPREPSAEYLALLGKIKVMNKWRKIEGLPLLDVNGREYYPLSSGPVRPTGRDRHALYLATRKMGGLVW
jgi:hypothetical protein